MKRKQAEGGVATVVGGVGGSNTGDMIENLGALGFDGAWIETEHGPFDYKDLPDLTRACDLWGMTSVVRVALNLPGVIYRTMDVGAQGIVVPHVDTVEDARAVVDAGKFAPIGHRGNYTSRQGYGVDDYLTKANDETLLVVLIRGHSRHREPGRDPDGRPHRLLSSSRRATCRKSMGLPGGMNSPEVQKVVDGRDREDHRGGPRRRQPRLGPRRSRRS